VTTSTSGKVNVTLQTYSSGSLIGTRAYSFNLVIPDTSTYQPEFTIALTRQNNSVPSEWNIYVQGISGVSVNISETSYKYSATYKSAVVTVGGIQKTSLPAAYTTLNSSGTVNISVKVTDSRGLSKTETTSITVYEYTAPSAKFTSVYFSDDEGYVDDSGGYINAHISHLASSCDNKNVPTTTLKYRQFGGAWSDNITHTASGGGSHAIIGDGSISSANTYELSFTIEDEFGQYETIYKLGTAFIAFNVKKGGKGAAFGKYSETNGLLEVDYDLKVNGKCQADLLWSSDTPLTPTNSVTLSKDLFLYRLCVVKVENTHNYLTAYIASGGQVRATLGYAYSSSDYISVYATRGTYTQKGNVFTLDDYLAYNIATSGITKNTSFTGISEIWGIK